MNLGGHQKQSQHIGTYSVKVSIFRLGLQDQILCKTCDSLNCRIKDCTNEEMMSVLIKEVDAHHGLAELGFQSLQNDTTLATASKIVISFDLQQNLPVPFIQTGLVFYLRQLWVYNLGIHNVVNGNGYMCMWDESIAKRGSDEVASCLLNYLQTLRIKPKHLITYSDGSKQKFLCSKFLDIHCFNEVV